jgi:hypothetical protein
MHEVFNMTFFNMTFRFSLFSASLCALAPLSAAAEGIEHLSYGATYTNLSLDGNTSDVLASGVSIDYRQDDFLLSGSLGLSALSANDDIAITDISARLGHFVMPQLVLYSGINSTNPSDASSLTKYIIGAEYTSGSVTFGLHYDDSSEGGYNETVIAYGSYKIGDSLEIGLSLLDTNGTTSTTILGEYDTGSYSIAAVFSEADGDELFGVNGSYEFADNYRAQASYSNFNVVSVGSVKVDDFTVGIGYEVSENLWVDLNVGQMSDDSVDDSNSVIEKISLGLTYKLGKNTLYVDRAARVQTEAYGITGQLINQGYEVF